MDTSMNGSGMGMAICTRLNKKAFHSHNICKSKNRAHENYMRSTFERAVDKIKCLIIKVTIWRDQIEEFGA